MPDTNPSARDDTALRTLVRELEVQIETLSSWLNRMRGTVDRLSAAAAAPATAAGGSTYSPAPPPAGVFSFGGLAPREYAAAPQPDAPVSERAYGGSSAEGASWPSLAPSEASPLAPPSGNNESDAGQAAISNEIVAEQAVDEIEALVFDEAPQRATEAPLDAAVMAAPIVEADAVDPVQDRAAEAPTEENEDRWSAFFRHHEGSSSDRAAAEEPGGAAQGAMEAAAQADAAPQPSLASGWPDESSWSQSFVWPAMNRGEAETHDPPAHESADPQADIRAIVAQVRAELESGILATESEMPPADIEAIEASADDDAARRAEVERTVEALKAELSGRDSPTRSDWSAWNAESLAGTGSASSTGGSRSWGLESELAAEPSRRPSVVPDGVETEDGGPADEGMLREEVRQTVEAARAEPAIEDPDAKPAFPLAAPRSAAMEWEDRHIEVANPPIIVVKHKTGRVELSQVYETLNALECGDSAALLNYTPHSVTVGLPIWRTAPDRDRIAEVAQRVFGATCRVDSEGTRLTINVGEDGPWTREGVA